MKPQGKFNYRAKNLQMGITLIELTIVIVVLLTLITVLFFSGSAYINASNKSACVASQAKIQKALRGYQILNQLTESNTFQWDDLSSAGYLSNPENLECPSNRVKYLSSDTGVVPPPGTRIAPCADSAVASSHTASDLSLY